MNRELVDRVVAAVLYEGYMLYPYRPSVKNRQRWTFGGLCPEEYCAAHRAGDASAMQAECLVAGGGETAVDVTVRFLHLVERKVRELEEPLGVWPAEGEPPSRAVEFLRIGGQTYQAWQEAVERSVDLGAHSLNGLMGGPGRTAFEFPARRWVEPLRDEAGEIRGLFVRDQAAIRGAAEISATVVSEGLAKVTVRIANQTPLPDAAGYSRDRAMAHSLVSTHAVLAARGGAFVSLTSPPERWREAARACRNVGTWPVLVGHEGATDTILCSPIILYDYPRVAPESPGDLFDATEIDEILTLRILAMTEDEKRQAAGTDERARAMLERTESLAREQLRSLHGAVRGLRPAGTGGGS